MLKYPDVSAQWRAFEMELVLNIQKTKHMKN